MTLKPSKTIEENIKKFCDEYKIIERSFETCWLNDGFKVYEYYHCKNGNKYSKDEFENIKYNLIDKELKALKSNLINQVNNQIPL